MKPYTWPSAKEETMSARVKLGSRKIKFRFYISTVLIISSLLILLVIFSCFFFTLQKNLFDETSDRLKATAVLGAEGINNDDLRALLGRMDKGLSEEHAALVEKSAEYIRLSIYLNKIRNTNPALILYAYILVPGETKDTARFVVDADVLRLRQEERIEKNPWVKISGFNQVYNIQDQPQTMVALAERSLQIGDRFISDPEYGTTSLICLAPIYDHHTGVYLASLGIDISDSNYSAFLRSLFTIAIFITLILLLLIILGSLILAWRISQPIVALTDAVRKFGNTDLGFRATYDSNIRDLIQHHGQNDQ
jgi:hypothetical protein